MSDDAPSSSRPPDEAWDADAEWAWLRREAGIGPRGAERRPYLIDPVLLLYVGFFFGPFWTFATFVGVARGRVDARGVAIVVGVCGAVWCMIQGLSALYGPQWSSFGLQGMRSAWNFAAGVFTFVYLRKRYDLGFERTWRTFGYSALYVLALIVVFWLTPGTLLVALGR